ncbi:hypothetical protein EVAR_36200_1 [Eumeta japonica]|uniref:Uncharacterized protein n=1 Tax=Eumeta variegata TaxID=151549 RepID=A0A4C1VUB9_EUMVA|nr:hypothetical protein EVAR_36200_1 [Eumeta japonica]
MRLKQEVEKNRLELINKKAWVFITIVATTHIFGHSANIERVWRKNVNLKYGAELKVVAVCRRITHGPLKYNADVLIMYDARLNPLRCDVFPLRAQARLRG